MESESRVSPSPLHDMTCTPSALVSSLPPVPLISCFKQHSKQPRNAVSVQTTAAVDLQWNITQLCSARLRKPDETNDSVAPARCHGCFVPPVGRRWLCPTVYTPGWRPMCLLPLPACAERLTEHRARQLLSSYLFTFNHAHAHHTNQPLSQV